MQESGGQDKESRRNILDKIERCKNTIATLTSEIEDNKNFNSNIENNCIKALTQRLALNSNKDNDTHRRIT